MSSAFAAKEAVGLPFNLVSLQQAQARTWDAVERIAASIVPGMTESDAVRLGEATLDDMGLGHAWHPLLIRFGENTLETFSGKPADLTLGENDIFFIDMGPVFLGHEGDAGATYVTGNDPEMRACADAARELFDRVRTAWNRGGCTGVDLYQFAEREAQAMGWALNLDIKGHRVSDFPHAVHKGGNLGAFEGIPGGGLWILEIQIRHPTRPFGAFFEDLLL